MAVGDEFPVESKIFIPLRIHQIYASGLSQVRAEELACLTCEGALYSAVSSSLRRINTSEPHRYAIAEHGGDKSIVQGDRAGVAVVAVMDSDGDERRLAREMEW